MKTITYGKGTHIIEAVALSEFSYNKCIVCDKEISNKAFIRKDGEYFVKNSNIFENSPHNILVLVHKKCKREFINNMSEYLPKIRGKNNDN